MLRLAFYGCVQEMTQEQLEELMQQAGTSQNREGQKELQISLEQQESGGSGKEEKQ